MKNINKKLITALILFALISMVNAGCSITLNAPNDNYYTTDQTPEFNYTITGNISEYNCSLYVNGVRYGSNETATNNTAIMIVANASIPYGESVDWYIYSSNNDSSMNCSSETRGITIGRTNFQAMNSIINLAKDIIGLIPNMITLVIYGGMLTLLGIFIYALKDFIGKR